MNWHWYVARPNELLLDWDSKAAVWWGVQKLRRNEGRGFLEVKHLHFYPSVNPNHFHMFVTLKKNLPPIEQAMWECHLGSDIKRTMYNVMRVQRGLKGADLLITNRPYAVREPDFECDCPEKHKPRRITNHCPILRLLHGAEAGAEYFAIRRDRVKHGKFRLPVGRVPLSRIRNT